LHLPTAPRIGKRSVVRLTDKTMADPAIHDVDGGLLAAASDHLDPPRRSMTDERGTTSLNRCPR
jgi:hypothetical protein